MSARAEAAARAVLERLGIEGNAARLGRLEPDTLRQHLEGAHAGAFAEALGELGDTAIAEQLEGFVPTGTAPPAAKAIRRALHRLRQRGVPVPDPAPVVPRRRPLLAAEAEGLVSSVDGRGTRIVWLVRPQPSGARLLISAEVNEPGGLRDLTVSEISGRQLRAARDRLHRETGLTVVSAPFVTLDALVLEAQDRAGEVERRLDYRGRLRRRLTDAPPVPAAEPVSSRVTDPTDDAQNTLVAESATLLEEPEFRSWWPTPSHAASVLEQIDSVERSPLVLSEGQQERRLADVLEQARAALYPPPVVARWLAGTAYVLAETGRTAPAQRALAAARLLRDSPQQAGGVPLLVTLVNQGVGRLLAARRAERTEERRDSLVVTPGEALRDRSSSHPRRTRE